MIRYSKPSIVDGGDAVVRTRGSEGHSIEANGHKLAGADSSAVGSPSETPSTNQVGA
jgi:hypothetical protein